MTRPSKRDYERLSEILRVANAARSDPKTEPDYGDLIARLSFESYDALRWWPNVRMELDSIQMRSRRGVWWSSVYTWWAKRLIDAARRDKILFIVGGSEVRDVPKVEPVDQDAMKRQYEEIELRRKISKMRRDA